MEGLGPGSRKPPTRPWIRGPTHCQSQGSGACPGGSEVMLLSSSLLRSHSCQCGLQVLFLSGSLPGLVSSLLSSSRVLLLPYQAPWGMPTGCAWQGGLCGACIGHGSLQLAPSECPVSLQGTASLSTASWLRLSCSPHTSPLRVTVCAHLSVCVVASPAGRLRHFLSWAQQSLLGPPLPQHTTHS